VITGRRVLISLLLAGAVAILVWGLTGVRPTSTQIIYKDPAVVSTEPVPGAQALRQERVGVTLTAGFTLAQSTASGLSINRTGIPQDQIEVEPGLNKYFYYPAPGKEVAALPPGRNCATAMIRRVTDPTDTGHPFSWCFNSA
jgi:hypothetical protein